MILPMLSYGSCATILLCYLVFALSGHTLWWSICANVALLIALIVAMKFLWHSPDLIYLSSLALILPVYSLRRYGKARWLRLDYSQLKPKQLI
jgi:membrane protein implicated in regulation of membrane protease activity